MLISFIVIVATVALTIFFTALYVAAEFATVSSRRTRISQLAGQGNRMAQMLLPMMEDSEALDNYVAACQVGITISSLVLGAYGQNVIAPLFVAPLTAVMDWVHPLLVSLNLAAADVATTTAVTNTAAESFAIILVLVLITVLQVIMGELFPKSVAIQYPEQVALAVVVPMRWSLVIFRPLISLFNGSGRFILHWMGHKTGSKHGQAHSAEEIELLVTESHESGLLEDSERQMLRNAFRLRDLTARQVMIHRTRLMAASIENSIMDIMEMVIEAGNSRIPIYRDTIDDILGFVHVKDLFRLHVQNRTDLESIIREVVYVPEMLPAADVWEKLDASRKYLAIVFDEYGGTAGLITFEDLIEEIFGELQDEFDNEMALVARDKDGRVYLRGDLLISDVNEYLNLNLPDEAADTLGGLIFNELGRPPTDLEEVAIGDVTIRVEAMADLGISELSLQLPTSTPSMTFSEWEVADHE
jgi:putative hemolysin